MDRQILLRRIMSISEETENLKQHVVDLGNLDIMLFPEDYSKQSYNCAIKAETIVCKLRNLVFETTNTRKTAYLASVANELGIHIKEESGLMEITIPSLVPKRKARVTGFIVDPLYVALSKFILENKFEKFSECVICFSHVYNKKLPRRRVRDYDNIELRDILNVLTAFVLTDDTGLLCDVYNTTELGFADFTQISIMKKDIFTDWLLCHKNTMKTVEHFA